MDTFIRIYKKAFDDTYCDKVIEYFNKAEEHGLTVDRQANDQVPKLLKEDDALFLPSTFPIHHTYGDIINGFNDVFWGTCYEDYANNFSILKQADPHRAYTIKVQKTKPGQGYHVWHAEATTRQECNRLLAWTAYMNDDFEAGETEFLHQQYRYKPSKGDVVIFPAAFTHVHRGNPPIGGDKYIITGWVEF